MDIYEFTRQYCLPVEQKAALDSLLYAFKEKRFKVDKLEQEARERLVNVIICRGSGLEHFDLFLDNVLSHFEIATKEGALHVNSNAGMGH